MKTTIVLMLGAAVTWAFNPAWGAGEKYIKIDPTSGKPDYISKDDAKNVAGMPEDAKLCEIAFKPAKIPKVVTSENGEKKQENVDGYEFNCKASKQCTDERAIKEKQLKEGITKQENEIKKQETEIKKQEKIINPPPPPKGQPKPKPPTEKEKSRAEGEKSKAEGEKKKAEEKLKKLKGLQTELKRTHCTLKYFVGAGGDETGAKNRLTTDEIKERKIEHVVCTCLDVEIPSE